jgi:hypothetical protein
VPAPLRKTIYERLRIAHGGSAAANSDPFDVPTVSCKLAYSRHVHSHMVRRASNVRMVDRQGHCGGHMQETFAESVADQVGFPEGLLEVSGQVPRAQAFSVRAIRELPRHEMGPTAVNCFTGRPVAKADSFAGARLVDLLDHAGFSSLPRSELKRCVIVAGGLDGYQVIFSWNELYNTSSGPGVLVLYERDGRPLGAHLGALCLISAGDTQLGPRHLRHLQTVIARRL